MNNELTAALLTIEKCREQSGCPAGVDLQDWVKQLVGENVALKSEVPLGAIENGRAFADRLEAYPFECQAGNLNMCSDWQELRRCFEHLSEWAMHGQSETPATDRIVAGIKAEGVEMFVEKCREKSKQAISSDIRDNWWLASEHADDFAQQLREEADK